MLSYAVSQYDKISAYTMSFNVSEVLEGMFQYRNIWNEVKSQLFEKLTTEPMQGDGKYMHGKRKTWEERIRTNFQGQDVPYDMYCNETAVLNIDSVYKKSKNYYRQVYVEECKCTVEECQQYRKLSDSNDDGYFEV